MSGQGVSVGGGGCTAPLSRSLRLVPDGSGRRHDQTEVAVRSRRQRLRRSRRGRRRRGEQALWKPVIEQISTFKAAPK